MLAKMYRTTQRFVAATTLGGLAMFGLTTGGCEQMGEAFSRGVQAGIQATASDTASMTPSSSSDNASAESSSGQNTYTFTGDAEDVNIDPSAFGFDSSLWPSWF